MRHQVLDAGAADLAAAAGDDDHDCLPVLIEMRSIGSVVKRFNDDPSPAAKRTFGDEPQRVRRRHLGAAGSKEVRRTAHRCSSYSRGSDSIATLPSTSRLVPPLRSVRSMPPLVAIRMSQVCSPVWRQSNSARHAAWRNRRGKSISAAIGLSRFSGKIELRTLDENRLRHDLGDDRKRVDAGIEDAEAARLPDPLLAGMPVADIFLPVD